jgi:Transcriptional regulators of sugar metabolism
MLKEKRFDFILKNLEKSELLTYEYIATELSVSEDTIRRDIDYLHRIGLLSKVRGGAMQRSKNPLNFQDRDEYLKKEKDLIALKAIRLIRDNMTLFMDGGTTIAAIAATLPSNFKLRIITTNMMIVPILQQHKNIELIVIGGYYHPQTGSTVGNTACEQTKGYIADLYFMGTCGVHAEYGISAVINEDAEVKKTMLETSKAVIALTNHARLRTSSAFKVCDIGDIDVLITDLPSDDEALNDFRGRNLEII